jgi:hypothetical protein
MVQGFNGYDPSFDWDKYCKAQAKAQAEYIKNNQAEQEELLERFYILLINRWNRAYLKQPRNKNLHIEHAILLCIYICNTNKIGTTMENNKLYSILDTFPLIDALDFNFLEELESDVNILKLIIEKENK